MTTAVPTRRTIAIIEPIAGGTPLAAAIRSFAGGQTSVVLDLPTSSSSPSRYTILAFDPVEHFVLPITEEGCPFRALEGRIARWPRVNAADESHGSALPFAGGWIGFFTYEAGLRTERIASSHISELKLPLMEFSLYDHAAVYEHATKRWHAVAVEWPAGIADHRGSAHERLTRIRRVLNDTTSRNDTTATKTPLPEQLHLASSIVPAMSREGYLDRVTRIREYIAAGDVYQVNLTQRFDVTPALSPAELYLNLREVNPAPYSAFIPRGDYAILSASPELFLHIDNRHILTRPIKGTRPRTGDPFRDAAARRELASSEKDRAELVMIVDLLRNDLGRVCEYGSIRVLEDGAIEEHPTVFHRVATIEGRLRADVGLADILRATCPGGSVTGAPKIRAMQIIDELEPVPRGAYCGSIGYVGLDGRVQFNLAIRTMTQVSSTVHVHAGGGIVYDSEPHSEYDETIAKARGMFRALGVEL